MTWRDVYNQPSLGGAPFHVDSTEESGGRRLATHEYPGRDIPYHEELGQSARQDSFSGYVSGANYHIERDALKRVLNSQGPHELVHPYHGVLQVHVRSYTLRESTNDGGVARFNITFAVAGEARYPTARANTKKGVKNKTAILRSAARASFLDGFTTGGFPGFVSTAAQTVLSAATDVIESAFTVITGDQAAGADYLIRLADIRNNLSALTSAPQDLADELTGLFDAAAAIVSGPSSASRANRQVYDDTSKTAATGATPARQRQAANTNALRGYTRALALAGAADEAVDATYETFNQAAETQAAILEQIDTETHLVDDDDLFLSLEELRGALAAAVPDPDSALPQLVTYTPATTEPSLVAAQRLYGDAARGDEIVARNMIKHPMFLPGSQALQVLADV